MTQTHENVNSVSFWYALCERFRREWGGWSRPLGTPPRTVKPSLNS